MPPLSPTPAALNAGAGASGLPLAAPAVLWTPPAVPRQGNIFWSHIPKTSTIFARTIFAYACGAESENFAKVSTDRAPIMKPGSCTGLLSREQDALANTSYAAQRDALNPDSDVSQQAQLDGLNGTYHGMTWYHMPVPWDEATEQPLVHALTMMRDPT